MASVGYAISWRQSFENCARVAFLLAFALTASAQSPAICPESKAYISGRQSIGPGQFHLGGRLSRRLHTTLFAGTKYRGFSPLLGTRVTQLQIRSAAGSLQIPAVQASDRSTSRW